MTMWRENLFFGNLSEIFRTDGRKFFGRTTDGQTEIVRPVGRFFFGRSDGQVGGNLSDIRTAGRPNGRTDGRKNNEKIKVCLKR